MMHESGSPVGPASITYRPRFLKQLLAVLGVSSGFLNVICGIVTAISTSPFCIIDGILMVFIGLAVITLETPFNCAFFPFMEKVNAFTSQRTAMQRSIIYIVCGLFTFFLCISISTFLGGGSLFAAGALYVWKWYQERNMASVPIAETSEAVPASGVQKSQGPGMYSGLASNENDQMGGFATSAGSAIASRPDLVEKAASGAVHGYMVHQQQQQRSGGGNSYFP